MTKRQKTDIKVDVPLLKMPKMILDKYKDKLPNGLLLPILSNQKMNAYLKEIGDICGIRKVLTFHLARHTFGSQVCLSQGVPIETVSQAMGHKNISTTQRYAKVTNEKIDRDVTALHFNIADKYALKGIDAPPSTILKDMSKRKVRPSKKLQMQEGI